MTLRGDQGFIEAGPASKPSLTVDTRIPSKSRLANDFTQSAPVGTRQERGIQPMYQAVDRHCAKLAEMMNSPTWRSQNPEPETINVIEIHPFPQTPEASDSTVIISASVSMDPCRRIETLLKDSQSTFVKKQQLGVQSKSDEDLCVLEEGLQETCLNNPTAISQDSPPPDGASEDARAVSEGKGQKMDNDCVEHPEQGQAVDVINKKPSSPGRHVQTKQDEDQRFKDLLDRLHHRRVEDPAEAAAMADPAIISLCSMKSDRQITFKRSKHIQSDSGYASLSASSRPPTRTQSRLDSQGTSDDIESETVFRRENRQSNESGSESPSKYSTLNPAAREFSSVGINSGSPGKAGVVTQDPLYNKLFQSAQGYQSTKGCISPPGLVHAFQPPPGIWLPPLAVPSPMMCFPPSIQQTPWRPAPGILPYANNFAGTPPPPLTGCSSNGLGPCAGVGVAPGLPQGFSQELIPPPPTLVRTTGLAPAPSMAPTDFTGPFHQQLPNLVPSCNNPAHQTAGAVNAQPVLHAGTAGFLPQNPIDPVLPATAAIPSSSGAAFIPKHVPKPKVPNTTGQQNWELMHELRRMNEPGYAQKCKEKQKKRFMKQLEKSGGPAGGN
ncbi:hypothetical protein M406DRAFT_73023 [Cryphonectria parasitica EP155]|uniref:Uncharacterized protein n=1 Tax=Cryphonectria parasitica (strain ATCC 38755 / EP155) TaxID=660469 RepID=A0A9P4XTC0_CRYP1|nr:uncharacterized protein M406DRAFT_73023 [Cryphonectria parasitica EP155]KAF3760538.1 hypothetical protein M406DRAFT_73023 [Cryphonectria parasitica EP155]